MPYHIEIIRVKCECSLPNVRISHVACEWVESYICESSRMWVSRVIYEWVSESWRMWMNHIICECTMLHVRWHATGLAHCMWVSHVTYKRVMTHVKDSCHTLARKNTYAKTRSLHVNEACHTHESVMVHVNESSHIWESDRATCAYLLYANTSCHIRMNRLMRMSHVTCDWGMPLWGDYD